MNVSPPGPSPAEIQRLVAELDQARLTAEDNDRTMLALREETRRLIVELHERRLGQRSAEARVGEMQQRLEQMISDEVVTERRATRHSVTEEELRVTIEEFAAVAEELQHSNESLQKTNALLEERVAERTAALVAFNEGLTSSNRALEARVAAEVAAREEAQAALFRQQKLEALGQLTGGIAHDFNNLLTVVISGLHMLARAETDGRRQELIGRIGEAAGRGSELTRRLLAFGRRQALRPEALDVEARMADLCELLGGSLRADVRLRAKAQDGLWPIEVDHGALELALLNLAVNARDAMPHGGEIKLSARNLRFDATEAAKLDLAPGDYVELSVTDSGSGMRPEVLRRAFEPFFTTKEPGQGSGLGLPQVYGFARQSGGTARLESEWGEGCTVSLLLPRTDKTPVPATPSRNAKWVDTAQLATLVPAASGAEEARQEPAEADGGDRRGASVLVVEDDDEVAALVVDMLAQLGHQATRVSSVNAALGALANDRKVDVVFSDVLLPGGANGVDLAHEVSKRRPEIGIVLSSGYGPDKIGNMGEIRWPLLRKPYPPDVLRVAIQDCWHAHLERPVPLRPARRSSASIGY